MKNLLEFQQEAIQVYYDLKNGKIDRQKAKEMNASLNIVIKSGLLAIMEAQARSQMPTKQLFSDKKVIDHKD
jgi:hypothetical protein